ncbi:DUF2393 family protein [Caminibacter mediatlanticus]|uniref:DUF2393 domain-containing protein n=1 Tax=Caminibacter mediatlanticus TB-2 TaxID=391592 RepID=A0AAI9AH85_9BACT|nr:DUF2393 family protein [Caminibacter mediatlanticus]EDM23467.1 hypothetical protein CMTB2_08027 [Caminibacter mediatlanticus TB-2]
MMIPYFTFLHWLDIAFFLILFIFLTVISVKAAGENTKLLVSMIFASFLITIFSAIIGLVILEKYTKKAKLLDITQRRVLINETLVLKGRVKNIGKFKINYCKLEIKLVNNGWGQGKIEKGTFFKPGGLSLFGSKDKKPNTIKATRIIIKNGLLPGEIKNFSAIIPYPPYFRNTYLNYKLYCH